MFPGLAFAGGAFLMFALTTSESIDTNAKLKQKVAELIDQQAVNTEMRRQLKWQSEEILLSREKLAAAEKKLDAQSWNGGVAVAVATVATATIVAIVQEMR
jgi:hypothetical protein